MPAIDPPAIEIAYIGGPTAVLSAAGVRFITDPTFDAAGGEYPSGAVTLKKLQGPAVAASEIGKIDVALVSHDQHADNLDRSGRALLKDIPLVLTTKSGSERVAGAIGLEPWQSHTLRAPDGSIVRITATPARHGPPGIEKLSGEVIGFVISIEGAGDVAYVTGDTVWYGGTAEVAKRFDPKVVLLFAGAAATRGPFHLTMDTNDAVEAAVAFPHATIVPIHHEGWAHFTQSQQDIAKTYATVGLSARLQLVDPRAVIRLPLATATRAGE
jgi:L-ascorbate metabolism protein UlaG (beta-lactamase superfamily)